MSWSERHEGLLAIAFAVVLLGTLGWWIVANQRPQVRCVWSPPIVEPGATVTFSPDALAGMAEAEREAADGWCPAP